MFGRKSASDSRGGRITTIVGSDAQVTGTIVSASVVRIDGQFEGDIRSESDIVVGESGCVKAKVLARGMSVAGEVRGDLQLSGRLEIFSSGKVFGEIAVSSLATEEGGVFKGKCDMGKDGVDACGDGEAEAILATTS